MSSSTEQIKERLPIVEALSSYIKLERAGSNYKARCPFHNEKTPSFIVSPSRNTYHCFGCNRGGDIFSFVEEIEGIDFKRALAILADRAGVALPRIDPKMKSAEVRAYQVLEEATRYFESNLKASGEALDYLKSRALTEETVRDWRLGYALNDWQALLAYLKGKKFFEAEIEKAGLVIKKDGKSAGTDGYYDRFRGRIMFPIANSQGKIVGFSGRHFVSKDNIETDTAKYINTPETPLYNKSRVLYGFDRAKRAIMQKDEAVLVEGQVDLVMSHQAGLTNTVASSGTALSEEHLKMIKRFTPNLVMAYDGDEAGFAASERGFNLALSLGMDVRIAKLPMGVDPADLAARDKEAWLKAVGLAKHIVDFYLNSLLERGLEPRKLKSEVSKRVLPYIALIRNRIDQAHFVGEVAKTLGLEEAPIWEEIKKIELKTFEEKKGEDKEKKEEESREQKIRDKITGIILWQEEAKKKERRIDVEKAKERLLSLSGDTRIPKEKKENFILQAEVYYAGSEYLERELNDLFLNLEQDILDQELKEAMAELRLAERGLPLPAGPPAEIGKDEKKAEMALKRCHEISKKINIIKEAKRL